MLKDLVTLGSASLDNAESLTEDELAMYGQNPMSVQENQAPEDEANQEPQKEQAGDEIDKSDDSANLVEGQANIGVGDLNEGMFMKSNEVFGAVKVKDGLFMGD